MVPHAQAALLRQARSRRNGKEASSPTGLAAVLLGPAPVLAAAMTRGAYSWPVPTTKPSPKVAEPAGPAHAGLATAADPEVNAQGLRRAMVKPETSCHPSAPPRPAKAEDHEVAIIAAQGIGERRRRRTPAAQKIT
jgi:hypothetical protein